MTAHDPDSKLIFVDGYWPVIDRTYSMVAFGDDSYPGQVSFDRWIQHGNLSPWRAKDPTRSSPFAAAASCLRGTTSCFPNPFPSAERFHSHRSLARPVCARRAWRHSTYS